MWPDEDMRKNKARSQQTGLDRRRLRAGSAALATTMLSGARAGGQDLPKIDKAQRDKSATDPGPENKGLRDVNQNTFLPPNTDHGEVQTSARGWLVTAGNGQGLSHFD